MALLNECPGYDTKQSDSAVPVMLEFEGRSTPLLLSLLGPLWPEVVSPDTVLSIGQKELNSVIRTKCIVWNKTVYDIETVLTLNWIV